MYLIIHKPEIKHVRKNWTRLSAQIEYDSFSKEMYFEVPSEYEEYLCSEVADAFLLALYYFAANKGYDIKSESPISEDLLYQFKQYFSYVSLQIDDKHYKKIQIEAEPICYMVTGNYGVAASASGGVDSFYSVVSHANHQLKNFRLTHLLVANLFNKYDSEEITHSRFNHLCEESKKIAKNYHLSMVPMYTNHYEFLFDNFVEFYSFRLCSYAMALQKLFKVYLVSSGTRIYDVMFKSDDSSDYDLFNLQIASNANLRFYDSGGEVGRIDKLRLIAADSYVNNNLHVCNFNDEINCSACDKCLRTMADLEMIGKLDLFKNVFNIDEYYKRKNKFWGRVISDSSDIVYGPLYLEMRREAKQCNYHIPLVSYFYAYLYYIPFSKIKNLLRANKTIHNLYYKFKIDYLIHGKEKAEIYRYGKDYTEH